MPNFQAVSHATHADKRWKRHQSYTFAAQDALSPLAAQELPRAALYLPIAFVAQREHFTPVAVLGLESGHNLWVAPDGRWLAGYTPAAYRVYPFALANLPDGQQVLAFNEDSGLMAEAPDDGEPFFDADAKPAQVVQDILAFLSQVQANEGLTQSICKMLAEYGLLQPWHISVQSDNGERQVQGLYRIDEPALNELSAESLKTLQQAGALSVAYSQLLSMQHLPVLGQLAHAQRMASEAKLQKAQIQPVVQSLPTAPNGELDLSFLNKNGTFSFS